MVIGKLFQIRGAVELNARPVNTVLSVSCLQCVPIRHTQPLLLLVETINCSHHKRCFISY